MKSLHWAALMDGMTPCRYSLFECWVWFDGAWVRTNMMGCRNNASAMTEVEFERLCPEAGPLPPEAFAG
jgi:hypothetical protein